MYFLGDALEKASLDPATLRLLREEENETSTASPPIHKDIVSALQCTVKGQPKANKTKMIALIGKAARLMRLFMLKQARRAMLKNQLNTDLSDTPSKAVSD